MRSSRRDLQLVTSFSTIRRCVDENPSGCEKTAAGCITALRQILMGVREVAAKTSNTDTAGRIAGVVRTILWHNATLACIPCRQSSAPSAICDHRDTII